MQMSADNRGFIARSGKWAALVAFVKVLAEYAGDYVSGNTYGRMARLSQEKQNVK